MSTPTRSIAAVTVLEGSISAETDTVVVGDDLAAERDWTIGDHIDVVFPDAATSNLQISGIIEQTNALPTIVAAYGAVAPHGIGLDRAVFLSGDADAIAAVDADWQVSPPRSSTVSTTTPTRWSVR